MPDDPYKYFRIEARELLVRFGKDALALEREPDGETVPRLLRLAHTLKGAARVVKQPAIAEHAHAVEDLLAPFRDGGAVPRRQVDALLAEVDAIAALVAGLDAPARAEPAAPVVAPDETPRSLHADVSEMDALVDGIAEAHARVGGVRRAARALEQIRQLSDLLVVQPGESRRASAAAELRDRVVALQRALGDAVDEIDAELGLVKDSAERLRLLPVESMLLALERAARDAARSLGKRVVFSSSGGEIRLDAHVFGVVQGALVQAVRNAVAHGVEPEAQRVRAGKPPEGRITVVVSRSGRRVVFTCRDDGPGVDLDRVRAAARLAGIARAETLSDAELMGLLLKGGLSTAPEVTTVAGRGIGLDVVREAAARLGGTLDLQTERGRGTDLVLAVPVSVASLDAVLVEASGSPTAIPLDAVRGALRVQADDFARTPDGEAVLLDGKLVPFAPLARLLGRASASAPRSAVVVEASGSLAAFGVDRLLGTGNIVLRALPPLAPADPVVAGAYLDPEGTPLLVLDPAHMVALARRPAAVSAPAQTQGPSILVVDDSLTTRMLEQSILESAGYCVDLAVSGEDALQMASRNGYALFLVDVEMPGMDGFEFVERTRADPALRAVPCILVTSRAAPADRARGEQVGAAGYVVKGEFDQNALLGRIAELVRA